MKRALLIFLALGLGLSLLAADEWPGKYAEVRAYAWTPKMPDEARVILDDMKVRDGAINKDGAILSADQVKRLLAAITGEHAKYVFNSCYEPHNAFIFYDADKKPFAYLEICFSCRLYRPKLGEKWKSIDLVALATIFNELKLPFGGDPDVATFKTKFDNAIKRESEKAEKR